MLNAAAAWGDVQASEASPIVAGSPDDVPDLLEESRQQVDSLFGPGPFDSVHRLWNQGANWLEENAGLKIGMNYTLVYQHGTRARDESDSAGGDLDLFGSWKAIDFGGRWPGRLAFSA